MSSSVSSWHHHHTKHQIQSVNIKVFHYGSRLCLNIWSITIYSSTYVRSLLDPTNSFGGFGGEMLSYRSNYNFSTVSSSNQVVRAIITRFSLNRRLSMEKLSFNSGRNKEYDTYMRRYRWIEKLIQVSLHHTPFSTPLTKTGKWCPRPEVP